jgi:cardiolipin synthase A/B
MSKLHDISDVKLFSNNRIFLDSLLDDIQKAQHNIYFEMYRITKEAVIGARVRDALAIAASRGVKVVLLVDAWGTGSSVSFFEPLVKNGGQVRIFNTFRLGTKIFTQSHRRNHRKIITIDDTICYIGSSNISFYSQTWRELMLRITGGIARPLRHIIQLDFKTHQKYEYSQKVFSRTIHFRGFEIIRDIPSIYKQRVMRKYLYLIKNAKESVYIETPYFLPGFRLRRAMADACQRGVNITIVLPRHSDVRLVDILRNKYLGQVFRSGVHIMYYSPGNLHSKLMIVDNSIFCVGSTNFDYRSFRYMHEIVLSGKHPLILGKVISHQTETMNSVVEFDFDSWKKRPRLEKLVAWLLIPFRYFF